MKVARAALGQAADKENPVRLTIHRGAAGDVDVPIESIVALDLANLAVAWKANGRTIRSIGVPMTLETEETRIVLAD